MSYVQNSKRRCRYTSYFWTLNANAVNVCITKFFWTLERHCSLDHAHFTINLQVKMFHPTASFTWLPILGKGGGSVSTEHHTVCYVSRKLWASLEPGYFHPRGLLSLEDAAAAQSL